MISLAKDNSANSVDIGFYGRYNDGSDKYLGFFADASDSNRFKLFKGTGTEPTTTVDTAASGYEYADVLLASLEARGNLTIKQQDDSGFDGGLIYENQIIKNSCRYGRRNVHKLQIVRIV